MKHILIDLPLPPPALDRLRALQGVTVQTVEPSETPRELRPELLDGQHILLCKRPPRNFDALRSLELMQLATVGYEDLNHLGLADRAVHVCNARGLFDTAIGEWNLAMMVNLTRDLPVMLRNQERATWERSARFQQEVRGKVVGLWGYGGIGRETARLAKVFGMTVHVLTRSGVGPRRHVFTPAGTGDPDGVLPDRVFTSGQEREFLAGLDYVVVAVPRTRHTTGLIGEAELRALPRTAFVLNPARGPIIREEALLAALREGRIAGAALDTHYAYPLPPEHALWRLPNVILTPHISGADQSRHFPGRMAALFLDNVERHLGGRPLLNEVTAGEWREA
jgi:phosphoglycerate dehydrogenase-like enzyme